MDIVIKIVQFFICFTLLVGIHEFGHFIMARLFKIRVDKFYIFFDPWFSIFKFKKGDTEYGLGWLPLGGYCKIAGMVDESMDKEQLAQPAQPDEFRSKPAWQRLIVMLAGVTMNLLLAIVIYIGVSYAWGDSYLPTERVEWGYNFNQAGHDMGFEDGDQIITIDGKVLHDVSEITNMILLSDKDRMMHVVRDNRELRFNVPLETLIELRKSKQYKDLLTLRMPFIVDSIASEGAQFLEKGDMLLEVNDKRMIQLSEFKEEFMKHKGDTVMVKIVNGYVSSTKPVIVNDEGMIGVYTFNPFILNTRHYTLLESIPAGFNRAGNTISSYWQQLGLIFQPKTEMYRELGGFVAIGNMFSGVWNWEDFWLKTAFLSIILAVMNILPIPGLDGGHSIITIYEMITGRKPSDKFLEVTQYVGMILILALMLYANGNDFYRLIFG
ncbi:MAG: RIP metalloprotease RseP [Rikenellaceae bacterium]